MLHKQEENLSNGEHDLFSSFQISGDQVRGPRGLILDHFLHNSEPLRYIWFRKLLVKYGSM